MSIKQGEYLKKLRTEKGLSQDALGEVLGISRQSVSNGSRAIPLPILIISASLPNFTVFRLIRL